MAPMLLYVLELSIVLPYDRNFHTINFYSYINNLFIKLLPKICPCHHACTSVNKVGLHVCFLIHKFILKMKPDND